MYYGGYYGMYWDPTYILNRYGDLPACVSKSKVHLCKV